MIDLSLLPDFVAESMEHLEEMETNLLRLEADPGNLEILNDIFRSIHTIKGASEYMGMIKIAELSHKLENLLDELRKGEKTPNKEIIDTLIESRDLITMLVSEVERSQTEETDTASMIKRIDRLSIETETKRETLFSDNESQTETGSESDLEDADFEAAIENAVEDVMEIAPSTDTPPDSEDEPDDALAEEIRDDDVGDAELFAIFTNQLNDSFTKIQAHLKDLSHSDDVTEILNQCTKIIGALRSSANYMGYDNLTLFYENWTTAISQAQNESVQAGKFSYTDFIKAYMKPYINKIGTLFPQLQAFRIDAQCLEEIEASEEVSVKTKEEGIETSKADDTQMVAETIAADQPESVVDTANFDEISDEIEPVGLEEPEDSDQTEAETAEPQKPVEAEDAAKAPLQDDQVLFEKLESAYDFYRQDHIPSVSDSQDMIDTTLFSKSDLTPEGRPVTDDSRFPPFHFKGDKSEKVETELTFPANAPETASVSESAETEKAPSEEAVIPEDATLEEAIITVEAPEAPLISETPSPEKIAAVQPGSPDETPEASFVSEMQKDHVDPEVTVPDKEPEESPKADEPSEKETTAISETVAQAVDTPIAEVQSDDVKETVTEEKRYGTAVKKSVRVDAQKIDDLMNQVGELVVSRAWFSQLYNEMRELQQYLKESSHLEQKEMKQVRAITFRLSEATVNLGRVATELQEGVMRVRMLPISQLFNRYPRLVRDLIHDTPKKVNLEIRGEDTELDKMIIEKISDPLIHIIRNAVDHGIEATDERRRLNKRVTGRITLEAYHESNHVVIEVRDDGQGLNPEKIKEAALARKFVTQEELDIMSSKEVTALILRPGFSTAEQVTHTSGRGVGMDVVKKNIEKLNGTLEIESEPGAFTQLRIKIPLTLAIIPALLVRVGKELYTIPLATVEETLRIAEEDNSTIEGNEVIYIRNKTLPLVRLSELFLIQADEQLKGKEFVVIVSTGLKKIGLVVDDLIGQEEVVIKPLEDYLQEKSGFSGATILGDGRVSLILDVYELVNLTIQRVTRIRSQKTVYGDFGDHIKAGRSMSEVPVAAM